MFDLEDCLKRINYSGDRNPTLETLKALQMAFVRNVPFENLDIHLGREIVLSEDAFYKKIVEDGRGGFCYECNTLFLTLLRALGFKCSYIAATMQLEIAMHNEFEHMALLVHLEDDYLVDAGNGQSCLQPMKIGSDDIVTFENIDYRLGEFEDRLALYFKSEAESEWKPRFSFTTIARQLNEYARVCHIIQTSEESHFTQKRVITIARPDGRITLAGRDLEITDNGKTSLRQVQSTDEYGDALVRYFGIRLESIPDGW